MPTEVMKPAEIDTSGTEPHMPEHEAADWLELIKRFDPLSFTDRLTVAAVDHKMWLDDEYPLWHKVGLVEVRFSEHGLAGMVYFAIQCNCGHKELIDEAHKLSDGSAVKAARLPKIEHWLLATRNW